MVKENSRISEQSVKSRWVVLAAPCALFLARTRGPLWPAGTGQRMVWPGTGIPAVRDRVYPYCAAQL